MKNMMTIQELSATGRHQECLQACKNALQAYPKEANAYKYAGKSLLGLGQIEKAKQCLFEAHELNGNDAEITKDIGNVYLHLGDQDMAIKWYEKSLEIKSNYAPAFNNIGNIKRQSGKSQEAINLFMQAIKADPELMQAYVGAAASFMELEDYDQAKLICIEALKKNEGIPGINEILGNIFEKQSKQSSAIKCYQKELEINPKASNSLLKLAILLLNAGQAAKALETLEQASAITLSKQFSIILAKAYQDLKKFDKAIDIYKKLNITQSKNEMIPFHLGCCMLETSDNLGAIEAFQTAIQLNKTFQAAWGNLGNALQKEGRLEEAMQAQKKVLKLDPDNPIAYMNIGNIYRDLGKLDQAVESTLQSLKLKPDNPDANMSLGRIYRLLGRSDQALSCLKKANEAWKKNEKTGMALAEILYDMGLYKEGIKVISGYNTKRAKNLLLSLYLCLDKKLAFNRCAKSLIEKRWLDQRGVAAIDHANILYGQTLNNGMGASTINSILIQTITKIEFSDQLMEDLLTYITKNKSKTRSQELLVNGSQTSGNIFNTPEKPFQKLKELIVQKIDYYNKNQSINTDKDFISNMRKNMYRIRGWAIIMNKGGNLKSHNHELGWLTGTFYLQIPKSQDQLDEGAIEFSHQGRKYPKGNSSFETRVVRPSARDLNIFSSSLFHRTLPFQSETQRVCIAFDVTRNEK